MCPTCTTSSARAFEEAYVAYEARPPPARLKLHKKLPAVQLWRKMLTMLFETGHPWITFKDACNLRSPQQHVGVVHSSSNLCTEITLNTSDDETAVCNLGSVNLLAHLKDGQLDQAKLARTVQTAMRMLDNVVDINFYATPKARNANLRHRPVGLGIMGFADCLYASACLRVAAAVEFADRTMEAVCYHAYWASTELARERGRYSSFTGSLWDQGILPLDSIGCSKQGGAACRSSTATPTLDWAGLKERIARHGMRNSNCVAIAPTATISNIVGVSASIEPTYQNLYVKSNLSGEFTVVNEALVRDLKALDLWDEVMVADLKYFDGSLARIERVPGRTEGALRHRLRDRPQVADRSRRPPPEVDRPGPVAEPLPGAAFRQEARRNLQAGLAARPEDHLLPAHAGRQPGREGGRAGRCGGPGGAEVLLHRQSGMRGLPMSRCVLTTGTSHRPRRCQMLRSALKKQTKTEIEPVLPADAVHRPGRLSRPDQRRRQAHRQWQGRHQPARAVQVPVGLGVLPQGQPQPLDAAGNRHGAGRARLPPQAFGRRAPRLRERAGLPDDLRHPGHAQHRPGRHGKDERPGTADLPGPPGL
jgi:hypothetical protein